MVIQYSGKFSRMREIKHFANNIFSRISAILWPYLVKKKTRHSRTNDIFENSVKFAKISRYTGTLLKNLGKSVTQKGHIPLFTDIILSLSLQ